MAGRGVRRAAVAAFVVVLSGCSWHSAWFRPQLPLLDAQGTPLTGVTERVIARVTTDAAHLRLRFENRYGATTSATGNAAMTVGAVTVAQRSTGPSVVPGTVVPVTFSGQRSFTLAPGASRRSDAIALSVVAGTDVAITTWFPGTLHPAGHGGDHVTHFLTAPGAGDHTGDVTGGAFSATTNAVYGVTTVDALGRDSDGGVLAIGDSIVDGFQLAVDSHASWPDRLALRIETTLPDTSRATVVNAGMNGTAVAAACNDPTHGPSVEARIASTLAGLRGMDHVIIAAGMNDVGAGCSAATIIAALTSAAATARTLGATVMVATITPAGQPTAREAVRSAVNAWIRSTSNTCGGACDAVADFDAALRDPADATRLDATFDSGDHVHPNAAGHDAMAQSIDLTWITSRPGS